MGHEYLVRRFVSNSDKIYDSDVRRAYGNLSGGVGVILNIILSLVKLIGGVAVNSVAITADGFNNLMDTFAFIIVIVSGYFAGKPADEKHPFGHARIEYVASSLIAMVTLLIAYELGKSSISRFSERPELIRSPLLIALLIGSILIKLWLSSFNRRLSKKTKSQVFDATAKDSFADVLATSIVLIALLLNPVTRLPLDAIAGIMVSLYILKSGIDILSDTFGSLIGRKPDPERVQALRAFILEHEGITGLHDMIIHDYGPSRQFASVDVEVDQNAELIKVHETADLIEREANIRFGIQLVVHVDPIDRDNHHVKEWFDRCSQILKEISVDITIHDFRLLRGDEHTNLIFHISVPTDMAVGDDVLRKEVDRRLTELNKDVHAVIQIDRMFTSTPMNRPKI